MYIDFLIQFRKRHQKPEIYIKDGKGNKRQIGKYAMGFGGKYDSQIIKSTCLDNDSRETE